LLIISAFHLLSKATANSRFEAFVKDVDPKFDNNNHRMRNEKVAAVALKLLPSMVTTTCPQLPAKKLAVGLGHLSAHSARHDGMH
jgi:hypothetical protein